MKAEREAAARKAHQLVDTDFSIETEMAEIAQIIRDEQLRFGRHLLLWLTVRRDDVDWWKAGSPIDLEALVDEPSRLSD